MGRIFDVVKLISNHDKKIIPTRHSVRPLRGGTRASPEHESFVLSMGNRNRITAIIEHPALEPFEPLLKTILEWGFDGGVRALEAAGYKLGDDLVDDKANECFKNGLFLSYSQIQPAVGKTYADLMKIGKHWRTSLLPLDSAIAISMVSL